MKKNAILCALTLLVCGAYAPTVRADEVWTTQESDVVYEEDRGRTAIWSYDNGGSIFIYGLAGVVTDRGSYNGYWTQPSSSVRCDTFRENEKGEPTYHWGSFDITFIDSDFPSRWYANVALCDGAPFVHLDGEPVTALSGDEDGADEDGVDEDGADENGADENGTDE
ncbi:MAG: hypothetical protein AB8B99_13810 [Phormidesmis sp.]